MKSLIVILASLFISSMASANLNGFATVSCKYKVGAKTKKPVVTLSTVYSGDNFEPKVTLSVAYVIGGQKIIENAVVTNASYTEGFEGYIIEAVTSSLRKLEISIYIETGDASIFVDDLYQDHMTNLNCSFATAG
ncbi:MAG: hypothetical protein IT287_07095 [Bdellovibrionaceae bacterium]|nr:hypothetical protein [Pseudobdellovibrionaceae bacterium]